MHSNPCHRIWQEEVQRRRKERIELATQEAEIQGATQFLQEYPQRFQTVSLDVSLFAYSYHFTTLSTMQAILYSSPFRMFLFGRLPIYSKVKADGTYVYSASYTSLQGFYFILSTLC